MSQTFTGINIKNAGTSSFTPSRVDDAAVTLNLLSGQTGNALEIKDSTGTTLTSFDTNGIIQQGTQISFSVPILASAVDTHVWIAPRACKVTSIREIHSVAGGASAAVRPRKITDTSAPGAAAGATVKELTTATFDLTATANTTQTATLSATASDYTLAAGDKIAFDFSGTLTSLVGVVTFTLQTI